MYHMENTIHFPTEAFDTVRENFSTRDNPVKQSKLVRERETRHGYIDHYDVTLEDGMSYRLQSGIPKNSDVSIPIVRTTAFLTGQYGFNEIMQRDTLKAGLPFHTVSVEQTFGASPSLHESADNQLFAFKWAADRYDQDPKKIIIEDAVSRGAMIGQAVARLARNHDISIHEANFTVPCFSEQFDPLEDIFQYHKFQYSEAEAIARLIMRGFNPRIASSIFNSAKDLFQYGMNIPALLSGEAGDAAKNLPSDIKGSAILGRYDVMSQTKKYEGIYSKYPDMKVKVFDGAHLDCVCSALRKASIKRKHDLVNGLSDPDDTTRITTATSV